jgi:hypothetical protein
MRYLVICFLFSFFHLSAQDVLKYDGSFSTELSGAGNAKYSYYKDKNRNKILHGSFTYRLRAEKGYGRLNQDVRGAYLHGGKNGSWSIKLRLYDYKDEQGRYATGTIALNCNYQNGYPHGKWQYTSSLKYRDVKSITNGRVLWERYKPTEYKKLRLMFNMGRLTDTIELKTPQVEIIGRLNFEGLFNDEWLSKYKDFQVSEKYINGFMVSYEKRNNSDYKVIASSSNQSVYDNRIKTIDRLKKNDPGQLADLRYQTDTIKLLAKGSYILTRYLSEFIFDNPFMLFGTLEGDKMNFNQLKGLEKIRLVNQVSRLEQEKLDSIARYYTELRKINTGIINYTKRKVLFDEVTGVMKIIKYNRDLAEKFTCQAAEYVKYEDSNTGKAEAEKKCLATIRMIEKMPECNDRLEVLNFFVSTLQQKLSESEDYQTLIKHKLLLE